MFPGGQTSQKVEPPPSELTPRPPVLTAPRLQVISKTGGKRKAGREPRAFSLGPVKSASHAGSP